MSGGADVRSLRLTPTAHLVPEVLASVPCARVRLAFETGSPGGLMPIWVDSASQRRPLGLPSHSPGAFGRPSCCVLHASSERNLHA